MPVNPVKSIAIDTVGNAKTSYNGNNLYMHTRKDGTTVNCYFATRRTTLFEATLPFRFGYGIFAILKVCEMIMSKMFPKSDRALRGYTNQIFPGGRMNKWWFALVLLLHLVDDAGTSIGMQANENPPRYFERNKGFCIWMEYCIINGWTQSHTGAFRLVAIINVLMLSIFQYFGLFGPLTGLWISYLGFSKAMDGYMWWTASPNNFGLLDFLLFTPGRPTPHRMTEMGIKAFEAFRRGVPVYVETRRRMAETEPESWTWSEIWQALQNT